MFISTDKLQEISGVAPGGVFTLKVPVGYTYHGFIFVLGGTTFDESHISNLELVVNGKPVQTKRTGSELNTLNLFDRMEDVTDGLLYWDMERTGLDLREARERTLLGTGIAEAVRQQLQDPTSPLFDPVEVTTVSIRGTIAAGAVAPTLSVKARRSAPRPTNVVRKTRNFVRNPSGAGDFEISDLPNNEPLSRLVFKKSAGTGTIDRVRVVLNNITIFDRTAEENDIIQRNGIRTPQAGYFIIDPAEQGAGNANWPANPKDDLRYILTIGTGSCTIDIEQETVGFLEA